MANIAPISYKVNYVDFDGSFITSIPSFIKLEFVKQEREIGYLYLDVPDIYSKDFFKADGKIEVYRKIGGGEFYLECNTQWVIRLVRFKTDESGKSFIHILARDGVSLIDRRIIAYPAQSSYAKKTNNADNMILSLLRENIGSLAVDTARDLSEYFVIPPDNSPSICPSISHNCAWKKLLDTIKSICEISTNQGTYLTFDVVKGDGKTFVFEIYTGLRGVDRGLTSENKMIFSISRGNLSYSTLALDRTEERNYIYAGGQGEEDARIIREYANDDAISISPYNRIEDFFDATADSSPDYVVAQAKEREIEARAKIVSNSHIQQTMNYLYGYHYFFGDIVVMEHKDFSVDVHLDTVHIVCDSGSRETVKIYGRNLDDTDY